MNELKFVQKNLIINGITGSGKTLLATELIKSGYSNNLFDNFNAFNIFVNTQNSYKQTHIAKKIKEIIDIFYTNHNIFVFNEIIYDFIDHLNKINKQQFPVIIEEITTKKDFFKLFPELKNKIELKYFNQMKIFYIKKYKNYEILPSVFKI